jgi:predicted ATPase/DNA-binding SARP family transcriptional activator
LIVRCFDDSGRPATEPSESSGDARASAPQTPASRHGAGRCAEVFMTANGHHNLPPPLQATLLGQARVSVGDRPIDDAAWSLRSARSLLLLLLITPGHALPKERARDLLWPEATPDVGRNAFYKALHLLRRVLEPELTSARESAYIASRGGTVALKPAVDVHVDVDAFETALRQAVHAPPADRRGRLRSAIELYGGELLPTDRYEDWPVARREQVRFAWEDAILELAELDLAAGDPQASVPSLELLLAHDPIIEEAHRALMRGYLAAGQRERALRQYARCAAALASELGVEPDAETEALRVAIEAAVAQPGALPAAVIGRINTVPVPPTAIVGRDREIELLQGTLWRQDVRLLTLVGSGGVGKTRLALEVAIHLADDFSGGVAFVPLAAVRDPQLVLSTVATALGLRQEPGVPIATTLTAFLRGRELLLVLDNFEQVLDAAPDIGDLLASCPGLTVLATSRERLQLRGEHLHEVQPLAVPRPERLPAPAMLARYGSVALFTQHMRRIDPDFEVTAENCEVVSAICRHLEGLPLALELALAHARFFSLAGLLARLANRLDIESGPRDLPGRQRTLRATFAWSHDLLSPEEQVVFRRLGITVGGCSIAAATAICGDDVAHLRLRLHALAEKHLIRVEETDDGARVTMLETIREFAAERLRDSGEQAVIARRHAEHYLTLALRAEPWLVGADQVTWFARLAIEQGNIRAALDRGLADPDDAGALAVRAAVALWRFWLRRRALREGIGWLGRALLRNVGDPRLRARILVALARLHEAGSNYGEAEALLDEALPISRAIGDQSGLASAITVLGEIAEDQADFPRASARYRRALAIYRANGLRRESAEPLNKLAAIAYYQGEYDRATTLWEASLTIYRDLGDHWATGVLLGNLGAAAVASQDFHRAVTLHEENLAIARRMDDRGTIGRELYNLAEALQLRGDDEQDDLLTEALALLRETGDRQNEISTLALLAHNALARGEVGEAARLGAESLTLCLATGDRATLAGMALLERTATLALAAGQPADAARLLGGSEALRQELGAPLMPYLTPIRDRCLEQLASGMKPTAVDAAMTAGRALTTVEAIQAALAVCEVAQLQPGPLSPREPNDVVTTSPRTTRP